MTVKKPRNEIKKLTERLREVTYLGTAIAVLQWDQEVTMPKKGADARAHTISLLAGLVHNKFLEIDHDGLLSGLKKKLDPSTRAKHGTGHSARKLSPAEATIVRETWRSFSRERKLPETFVKEMAELASKSQSVWAEAREENNFAKFAPYLERMVEKKREEAKLIGFEGSPYDALLDSYEPGMTASEVERIFTDLKAFLVPFLARIKKARQPQQMKSAQVPIEKQVGLSKKIATAMGYDFDAGRIDVSAHPFTTSFHPHDVRITTRYNPKNILESIFPTMHEGGHALYEQGLPHEHFGTPLADATSLGIHESQSRLWENMVGKSLPFWKHWYPKLQKEFPGVFTAPLAHFYASVNTVKPTLIRVEADEVTYNLHIMLRFELEQPLISGDLKPADVPGAWNEKFTRSFGLTPPDAARGCLQDIHWGAGLIGYFPTYSLGNMYAAQFYDAAQRDLGDLPAQFARGEFRPLLDWLRKNIHSRGKQLRAGELVQQVSGKPLSHQALITHLHRKFDALFGLS